MTHSPLLKSIVHAVLYEGYILYPYRASSIKNQRGRFTFGRVYPKDYSKQQNGRESCAIQTECLLKRQNQSAAVEITVGFLQPMWREAGHLSGPAEWASSFQRSDRIVVDGKAFDSWQEATERQITVSIGPLDASERKPSRTAFCFPESQTFEMLGGANAAIRRRTEMAEGYLNVEISPAGAEVFRIVARVGNTTPVSAAQGENQDEVVMRTFASTHTILQCAGAEFISLLEPPEEFAALASTCKNAGTWPVLVGDPEKQEKDTMLSSPIILYDYQQIAPESRASFFDGLEIDELLTLRVMTLTDSEKMEMRNVDGFARQILERSESANADDFLKMHGVMRANKTRAVRCEFKAGDRVRICPKRRADAIDMILAGKIGIVEAVEQDAEEVIHLALVLEDDPGQDLGMARQSGHRFFYRLDEVEPLTEALA
ncbi:MAG TPA: hypothetical protein VGO59_08150 [Verrucomicrobiae bacterium]|jgi:hydrogenase maturation protease